MGLLAWVVFPLLALAICVGIGLLAESLARAALPPALLAGLGYGTAIAVLGIVCATGARGAVQAIVLVALALGGYAVAWRRSRRDAGAGASRTRSGLRASGVRRSGSGSGARASGIHGFRPAPRLRPGASAIAGVVVYALYIAPVALSGQVSFLGYNLLNDTAIHLALVDWIGDHGSRFIAQAPSSYGAAIHDYVGTHYPLGSHELLAALKPLVGLDPARIYQPFLAFSAAVAAGAIQAIARRAGLHAHSATLAAIAALASQLVFSFALQGGIKELSFIACLAAAAGLAAYDVRLMALPAAALYSIYGLYALPWIAPLAGVALWLMRPALRAALQSVGVFVVAVAVLVPDSISYYRHGHDVITSGSELGPLAGPLKPLQAAGIWLNGDYRFVPQHSWITYVLALAAVALAFWGAVRGTRAVLLFLIPALFAAAITAPLSSPYIDAKLLTVLSPALVLAAAVGAARLPVPRLSIVAAVALGIALLASDALAYRIALVAPVDRLGELAKIDKRFAGHGPILVNEYEEYVKHYMRRSRGSDPYEGWNAGRAQLRDPNLPVGRHAYDLDQLRTPFVERYALIALRRSPVESVPPSNYRRVWSGRWYEVWERYKPAPERHVPLGTPPYDPTGRVPCSLFRPAGGAGLADGVFVLGPPPQTTIVPIAEASPLPAGWYRSGDALATNKGGRIAVPFTAQGRLRVWIRGSAFRNLEVLVDGRRVGSVRELNGPNQWMDAGRVRLAAGSHKLELVRPTRSLRPGDAQQDFIGPAAVVSGGKPKPAGGKVCGRRADWVDINPS